MGFWGRFNLQRAIKKNAHSVTLPALLTERYQENVEMVCMIPAKPRGKPMRVDLLDAYAAIEWAVAQLPTLESRIAAWRSNNPYSVRVEADYKLGKKAYYVSLNPVSPLINAEVGAVINSLRSGLDLLANALAARNGHTAPKDVYFPVSNDHSTFLDTTWRGGKKKIRRLSAADQAVIEGLRPYQGGNDLLFALHQLDITRKHRRLLAVLPFPRGLAVYPRDGSAAHVDFNADWKGLEDKAAIAFTAIDAPHCKVDLGLYIALDERGALEGKQVLDALRQLAGLAKSIIDLFNGA